MARVREKRERMRSQSIHDLNEKKQEIEANPNRERSGLGGNCMVMTVYVHLAFSRKGGTRALELRCGSTVAVDELLLAAPTS